MPETLSINEFAAKVKERRPDLANIPDGTLVGKMLAAAPELKDVVRMEYNDKRGADYQSPRYTGTGATAGQVASDQAAEVLKGVPEAVTGLPAAAGAVGKTVWSALRGNATETAQNVGGMAKAVAAPFKTAVQGAAELVSPGSTNAPPPESPEWSQAARAGGAMLAGAELPNAAMGAGRLVSPVFQRIKGSLQETKTANYVGDRAIQSWMPKDMKAEKLGADPVAAVRQLPMAGSREGMLSHIDEAIGTPESGVEGELIKAIRRRESMAEALPEGYGTGVDVEPRLRSALKPLIEEARRHQGDAIANQIQEFADREISAIKQANGGKAYLDAGKILAEKRNFGSNVKFGTDTAAVTLNDAKQAFYRELDATFDHLVPEAAELNKFYSGLIEGKRLIGESVRKTMNSPLAHETAFGTLKSKFPETPLKTAINAVVTNKKIPTAGGSSLPFYKIPNPGYLDNPSGVAPHGGIQPINPGPVGAPDQFANPSGVSPRGPLSNVSRAIPPIDQFANPSGVAPGSSPEVINLQPPPVDYLSGKNPKKYGSVFQRLKSK